MNDNRFGGLDPAAHNGEQRPYLVACEIAKAITSTRSGSARHSGLLEFNPVPVADDGAVHRFSWRMLVFWTAPIDARSIDVSKPSRTPSGSARNSLARFVVRSLITRQATRSSVLGGGGDPECRSAFVRALYDELIVAVAGLVAEVQIAGYRTGYVEPEVPGRAVHMVRAASGLPICVADIAAMKQSHGLQQRLVAHYADSRAAIGWRPHVGFFGYLGGLAAVPDGLRIIWGTGLEIAPRPLDGLDPKTLRWSPEEKIRQIVAKVAREKGMLVETGLTPS